MATVTNGFEQGTNGSTITAAGSGGGGDTAVDVVTVSGAGSSATYDNTHFHRGSLAGKFVTAGAAGSTSYVQWSSTTIGTLTTVFVRAYIWLSANPTAVTQLFRLQNGGSLAANLTLGTSGFLTVRDASNLVIGTSASAIPTGQWVRLAFKVVCSATAGTLEARVYTTADSTTPTETIGPFTAQNTNTAVTLVKIGAAANGAAVTLTAWLDDIGASDTDWLGPATSTATAALILTAGPASAGTAATAALTLSAGPASAGTAATATLALAAGPAGAGTAASAALTLSASTAASAQPTATAALTLTATGAASGASTISDTFDRANSSTSLGTASDGGTWTVDFIGVWGIVSSTAYVVSGADDRSRARRDTGQVDADVTVTVARANTSGFSYLWFAYDRTSNVGYYLRYDSGGAFTVWKWTGDFVTSQIGGTITGTSWSGSSATLRVTYNHSTGVITVYQGGVSKGTVTDGTPITAAANTWVGFSSTQANSSTGETWDNFSAAAAAAPATTATAALTLAAGTAAVSARPTATAALVLAAAPAGAGTASTAALTLAASATASARPTGAAALALAATAAASARATVTAAIVLAVTSGAAGTAATAAVVLSATAVATARAAAAAALTLAASSTAAAAATVAAAVTLTGAASAVSAASVVAVVVLTAAARATVTARPHAALKLVAPATPSARASTTADLSLLAGLAAQAEAQALAELQLLAAATAVPGVRRDITVVGFYPGGRFTGQATAKRFTGSTR